MFTTAGITAGSDTVFAGDQHPFVLCLRKMRILMLFPCVQVAMRVPRCAVRLHCLTFMAATPGMMEE